MREELRTVTGLTPKIGNQTDTYSIKSNGYDIELIVRDKDALYMVSENEEIMMALPIYEKEGIITMLKTMEEATC